ncbi:LOW QUALITY PROTEIN: NADP-dependent oxidoreductase domain-containing protein 1 [Morphnus guianensis]
MWDITELFESSQADEAAEGEALMHLTRRRKGLAVNTCVHAIFCKLPHDLRLQLSASASLAIPLESRGDHVWSGETVAGAGLLCFPRHSRTEKGLPTSLGDSHGPNVGIIGRGHLGKQPAQAFLMLSWTLCTQYPCFHQVPFPFSLLIAADLQKQGLACFYDNTQLVAWVDVAFLCCLPSHVPSICSVVWPAIQKHCVVYSLVTTVPLLRTFKPHPCRASHRRLRAPAPPQRSPGSAGAPSPSASPGTLVSAASALGLKQLLCYSATVRPRRRPRARSLSVGGGRRGRSQRRCETLLLLRRQRAPAVPEGKALFFLNRGSSPSEELRSVVPLPVWFKAGSGPAVILLVNFVKSLLEKSWQWTAAAGVEIACVEGGSYAREADGHNEAFDFVCPAGKIRVNAEWLVAIFCAALNSSTRQSLPHQKALILLSDLCVPERCPICAEQKTSCPQFVCKSFASSRSREGTFPCFDLTAAQLEPPFGQLLEKSELVQRHLALLQAPFGDWPTKQCGLISTKTSLTSAVVEPGVMLDDKPPFSKLLLTFSQKFQRKLLTMILNPRKV